MTAPRPVACTWLARRPSFERDDRIVLASLLADLGPLPDSARYLAKLLNVSTRTATTYRDSVTADGIAARTADGMLVLDAAGFARWQERARADFAARALRFAFDAVPIAALAWGLSTAELRAHAIVFGEAVGKLANRAGCRTDSERAALAGVGRRYVVAARATLAERGCRVLEQRVAFRIAGGAGQLAEKVLRRVALPDDAEARRELCKRPALLGTSTRARAAAAADSGRRRPESASRGTLGRWVAPSATKEHDPSATAVALPIASADGSTPSPRCADQTEHGNRCAADNRMGQQPAAEPTRPGIVDELAAAMRPGADRSAPLPWQQPPQPVEDLAELLQPQRVAELRRMPAAAAIASVLAGRGAYTWRDAPVRVQRKLDGQLQLLAGDAARVLGAAALDDVLRLARQSGRKTNPGAWFAAALRNRVARVRAGIDARPDFAPRRGEPRDHRQQETRARQLATGSAVAAVRDADRADSPPTRRDALRALLRNAERGADLAAVAATTGRQLEDLQRVVDAERRARDERFATARRATA
jgi:hypothetical protein